ncbi:hypothetical protein SFRURICE_006400 [Spodoptera frugiperda]|nr:hypothetical protein SFRURICE_006400 [Spodoptera frugiperda]
MFYSHRVLQCTRIRIHVHLFISFALNNILWIIWYRAVVNRVSVVQENTKSKPFDRLMIKAFYEAI